MNMYADGDVDGVDVLGEVLGEVLGIDTMGDLDGMDTVGRRRRRAKRAAGRMMAKPNWRQGQLAPGVQMPREGLEPLPMVPDVNGGTFSAAVTNIRFNARPQRPFRGERLLVQVLRTGASAAGLAVLGQGFFVGTALQQLQIGAINLEFFAATAFGVRLDLIPAEPGIDISTLVNLSGVLAGADIINVQMMLLGRSIGA
jgi:hypothetical protein